MKRVGFVGTPGSGKTSTARVLSGNCRGIKEYKNIELIQEYARRYQTKYGTINNLLDQFRVMEKQIDWENSVAPNVDITITDSPVHLGYLYTLELRDINDPKHIIWMNDIYKKLTRINTPQRYDLVFHLPPIIKPVNDGVRPIRDFNEEWRVQADAKIKFIFKHLFPCKNFIEITSIKMEDRINECLTYMKEKL